VVPEHQIDPSRALVEPNRVHAVLSDGDRATR
jgi:hypothetical protein